MATDLREQLQSTLGSTYTFERELGGGGMSRVFLATEGAFGRRVVVKVLPPELTGELSVERFRREIQLASQLQHPHIVSVLSAGQAGGVLYYAMPFIDGETLRARLVREQQLTVEEAVRLAREVASALEYANQRGVVHRDIKPENILLSGGFAMVADFGIARAVSNATGPGRLTGSGITLGTPAYMSPEQASGSGELDGRSDIFALGCVLYEMLAGEPPFTGPTAQAVIARRFSGPAPLLRLTRTSVPPSLERVVAKSLAAVPADRYQTAAEMARALDPAMAELDAPAPAAAAVLRDTPAPPGSVIGHSTPRRAGRVVAYIAMAAVVASIAYASWRRAGGDDGGRAAVVPPASSASAGSGFKTIAVMPFEYIGGDTAVRYFADGITEELMGALAKMQGVRLSARTSVYSLRGKQLDARTLGDTLNVEALLEGSVRHGAGQSLRIMARLASTDSGYLLWSQEYEREPSDVFRTQDEIARSIVDQISFTLAGRSGSVASVGRPTDDSTAYKLYLDARELMRTRPGVAHVKSVELLQQAIARDPGFAVAYAMMAEAHIRLGQLGYSPPDEELPKARAAAQKALELDSTLSQAHASLAHLLCVREWAWAEANAGFARALELDRNNAAARITHSICLLNQGRYDDAERELRDAIRLDPLLPDASSLFGRFFVVREQPDSAIRYLQKALRLSPYLDLAEQQLGHAYLQKRMYDEAFAAFRRAAALSGPGTPRDSAHLAYAYAVAGRAADARRVLDAVLTARRVKPLPPVDIALAYVGLGDQAQAFRWLSRGIDERAPFSDHIKVMPGFETIRSDPRFVALIKRIGLPAD